MPTAACLVLLAALASGAPAPTLQARLNEIAEAHAKKYGCAVGIGVQTGDSSLSATSTGTPSGAHFVWGSVTKMLTGAALMRAVEKGQVTLKSRAAPLIDPVLASLGLGTMRQLFGRLAALITVEQLATMRSGVPDYDTAKPWPRPPKDPFRADCYAHPKLEYPPAALLNLSWVARGRLDFFPGLMQRYSSTNFVLLGLLLGALDGAPTWDAYDQASALDALPASRRALYDGVVYATHGAPADHGALPGYDRTSYNGANSSAMPGVDVERVDGVFAGFTASDWTASVADTARLGYDIFGQASPRALSPSSVSTMIPTGSFYGLATFNLSMWDWGTSSAGPYGRAYGHLGATYGYDSIVIYFPAADVSLAVGTTIETDEQSAPSDAVCLAYHAVLAALTNSTEPRCVYRKSGYWGGVCDCGNNWVCDSKSRKCVSDPKKGSLSKSDCEKACGDDVAGGVVEPLEGTGSTSSGSSPELPKEARGVRLGRAATRAWLKSGADAPRAAA